MSETAHQSMSTYRTLASKVALVKIPKSPLADIPGPTKWVKEHEMRLPDGKIVKVAKHLRHYFVVQPADDGSYGGKKVPKVEIHRNFFLENVDVCGRTRPMIVEVVKKTTTGKIRTADGIQDGAINIIVNYRTANEKAEVELKFADSPGKGGIQIPRSKKFITFKPLKKK